MPQHLEGMRSTFDFASHVTLFLHQRISGDALLEATSVRTVIEGDETSGLLAYLARLRSHEAHEMRFVPLAPGDRQSIPDVSDHPAVAISPSGTPLVIAGSTATHLATEVPPSWRLAVLDLSSARRTVHDSLREMTAVVAEERHLMVQATRIRAWELPEGFVAAARSLTATASTVLGLGEVLRSSATLRERGSLHTMELLSAAERAARSALVAVVSERTLDRSRGVSH